jgi:phosphatidylglycerophosphate synthase
MGYLSANELAKLRAYQYKSGLYGFVDRVVMTPFWELVVTWLPRWIAPNLVTLLALMHALFAYIVLAFESPTLTEPVRSSTLVLQAACSFIYQTLDAIDGKQARRTGASSPLGQLFDHGCDALSCLLMALNMLATLRAGAQPWGVFLFCIFTVPFYFANLEECHTGVMRFGVIGVTEAQLCFIGFYLFTAFFGQDIWRMQIYGYEATFLFAVFPVAGAVFGTLEKYD